MSTEIYLMLSGVFSSVFCLFLLLYMRITLESRTNSTGRRGLKFVMASVIVCVVLDMLCIICNNRSFLGLYIFRSLYIVATGILGCAWLEFYDTLFHIEHSRPRLRLLLYLLPAFFLTVFTVLNIHFDLVFKISTAGAYERQPLAILVFFLQYIPYVSLIVSAGGMAGSVKALRVERMRRGIFILCAVTLAFGIAQTLTDGHIPLYSLGMTGGVFVIFSKFQEDRITNDKLTGLSNRYALDSYLIEKMKDYSAGLRNSNLYLILIDINKFKSINDNFGHMQGDRALRCVANAMKQVGAKYRNNLFIGRFGGDEFCGVFEALGVKSVEKLCADIREALQEFTEDLEYSVTVSVGFAEYEGREMTPEMLYSKADSALYADKSKSICSL